jgi:hypothetical protein
MALYTFFPCLSDGKAVSFESHELADDEAAEAFAIAVLQCHRSCVSVAIWCGERRVTREISEPMQRGRSESRGGQSAAS